MFAHFSEYVLYLEIPLLAALNCFLHLSRTYLAYCSASCSSGLDLKLPLWAEWGSDSQEQIWWGWWESWDYKGKTIHVT